MGELVDEFARELDDLHRRCEGRPDDEMIQLWLVSLEREQIVNVGYRNARIGERIDALHVSREVRDLVRHALTWTWRDEEMHAIYVRGTLLQLRRPWLTLRTYAQHLGGSIAGWVTSVRMHGRWRDYPFSYFVASLIAWVGMLLGKISRVVAPELQLRTFKQFCEFNVEAERTASMAWGRLAELAKERGEPAARIDEYRRIEEDEDCHRRVFVALAESFDDDDRLALGVRLDDLAAKIERAGEAYVCRAQRHGPLADHPLGASGVVAVSEARENESPRDVLSRCVRDAGLDALVAAKCKSLGKSAADLRVVIKPSFMLGYHRDDRSTITDPALTEALALHLRALGVTDIAVIEGSNLYDLHYRNRSVANVAAYFGYTSDAYRLADSGTASEAFSFDRGIALYKVSSLWRDADLRITFGKLRTHPVELVYLSLANMEGLGARCDDFIFSDRQAHRDAALMTTANAFPPDFAVIDAFDHAADGLVGVMACTRPRSPKRIYAGHDAIAVDVVCARHVGVRDPRSGGMLGTAFDWFGDPTRSITVVGVDTPIAPWTGARDGDVRTLLGSLAYPVYEWGSMRGSLIVPEMDLDAFPPIERVRPWLRAVRATTRAIIGLRKPPNPLP